MASPATGFLNWKRCPGNKVECAYEGFVYHTLVHNCFRRSVVVGAGYIAVEMAGILKSLGSEVTLVIRRERVLRSFDDMISESITDELQAMGIKLLKNSNVRAY